MTAELDISVVIPTYNRREILASTLPTVIAQDFPSERREIIVVVDGSTDETIRTLRDRSFAVRVIEQANLGISAARNAGLRAARGRLVLFLDDDMLCEPGLLRGHVAAHRDGEDLIVGGEVELSDKSSDSILTQWRHYDDYQWLERVRTQQPEQWWMAVRFAHASAPRRLLIGAGGFDECFRFADEDIDLGLRLKKAGARYQLRRDLVVRHIYRKPVREFIGFDVRWYGRSQLLFCRKHPEHRASAPLGNLQAGSGLKAALRKLATASPVSPDLLLQLPFALASSLRKFPAMRRVANNLLDLRRSIGFYRGALDAAGSWESLRHEFGQRLPVLLYHHVGPAHAGAYPHLTVSPARFKSQMRWLRRRGYTAIRSCDWISWIRGEGRLPEKPVLITFDDAYMDIARYALPVLKRHGLTATVFVPTQCIGKANEWDKGTYALLPLLDRGQILEWASEGIEFGSHSRTHPHLTTLSRERLDDEIRGSAQDFQHITGSCPNAFAYPYGSFNQHVCDCVSRTFDLSFTTQEGINCIADNPMMLQRLEILPGDNLASFATLVCCGFRPVSRLRRRIALRTRLRAAVHSAFHRNRALVPSSSTDATISKRT